MTQEFYGAGNSAWRRALARIAATGAVVALSACQTTVPRDRNSGEVLGRVETGGAIASPLMVVAIDRESGQIVHRVFLGPNHRAFSIPLAAGHYKFFACADDNQDGRCNAEERTSVMYTLVNDVRAGEGIELPSIRLEDTRRVAANLR